MSEWKHFGLTLVGLIAFGYCVRALYGFGVKKGWLFPPDHKPDSTAMGNAMLNVQAILEPSKEHVVEQRRATRKEEEGTGDRPPV